MLYVRKGDALAATADASSEPPRNPPYDASLRRLKRGAPTQRERLVHGAALARGRGAAAALCCPLGHALAPEGTGNIGTPRGCHRRAGHRASQAHQGDQSCEFRGEGATRQSA
eukprot:6204767-Pleurochrysis_carterae.AAC.2